MVCSGINPPAARELAAWLQRERGLGLSEYVDSFLDILQVTPDYIGPPLRPGEDEWGVVREAVSYGSGSYDEIHEYPLGSSADSRPTWTSIAGPVRTWFDYAVFPDKLGRGPGGRRALSHGRQRQHL